ncbi:MAG: Kelch repeat-containing protein [Planctomycetota bacterium]|jgi:N-acetylneuraminic acid mutarotase
MKKTISLIWILVLIMASLSSAIENLWESKADMPTARMYLSTSVANGKIYAIGGASTIEVGISAVEEYDPTTDLWTEKSPMPTPRWGLSTSVVNGKTYAIGGAEGHPMSPLNTVEEYDPNTDTWTTKSPMPTARWGLSTCVVNGKIYAIGGGIPSGYKVVEEYDPATDTWTTRASMKIGRYALSTSVLNGKIYAIGGVTSYPSTTPRVEEYDPETDQWGSLTKVASMPTARTFFSTCVAYGRIYAIGGSLNPDLGALSAVYEYDPEMNIWTTMDDMLSARTILSASVVNGKIYAIGGSTIAVPWNATSTVEEYEPYPLFVDFNGDGIVNADDVCLMLDYWLTDEPLYDIAPHPFGDGVVDVQDLTLLAEHLFEEVPLAR